MERLDWRDLVFTTGSLIFILALIPSLIYGPRPHYLTSFITAVILGVYAFTFLEMRLIMSCAITSISCVLWAWMGIQETK